MFSVSDFFIKFLIYVLLFRYIYPTSIQKANKFDEMLKKKMTKRRKNIQSCGTFLSDNQTRLTEVKDVKQNRIGLDNLLSTLFFFCFRFFQILEI